MAPVIEAPSTPDRPLREALLDAAYDAAVGGEWDATRMADVAAVAGVSRQTLYNEFGSKDGLARAVVLRETHRFLDGVHEVLDAHRSDGIAVAVSEAALYTFRRAADDPLTKAILTSARGESLLPFLTTRSEPVLVASRNAIVGFVLDARPELDAAEVGMIAEAAVRLTVSHIVLPLSPVEAVAHQLGQIVDRYLERRAHDHL
ncbi:MAG: TetR family transcriptional regulator [Mycobacteriales bacterium]